MARKFIDHTGQIFVRWAVLSYSHKDKSSSYWNCRCICGVEKVIAGYELRKGGSKSCGCLSVERSTTHGLRKHPLYYVWSNMNDRCYNPANESYHNYGGRGIAVCDRWHQDNSGLKNFIEDLESTYQPGLTIERIDNNGDYSPSNCRWATKKEQQNNRRSNRLITFQNETLTLVQWSEKLGINKQSLCDRIFRLCWPIEKALTTPTRKKKTNSISI